MPELDDRGGLDRTRTFVYIGRLISAPRSRWAKFDRETRDWLIVTSASIGRLGIGLVASVVIARALGPANFGTYAILGVIATVAGVVADPGLTAAGVRRIAAAAADGSAELATRASSLVLLRGGIAFLTFLIVAAATVMPFDSSAFPPSFRLLVVLTMGGVVASALSGALSSIFQGTQRFGRLAVVLLTNAGLTAILALGLARVGQINLVSIIVILGVGTTLASAWVGWCILPPEARLVRVPPMVVRRELKKLLRFGAWVFVADVLGIVAIQIDLPVVSRWVGPVDLGTYALALTLASKADVVNHSLYTVLLPAASSLRGDGAVRQYLRRSFARSILIASGLVATLPLVGPAVLLLYGPSYAGAIGPLRALIGVAIVDIFLTPALLLAYHFDRPRVLAAADAARIVAFLVIALALVPGLGITGAVTARLGSRIAGAAVGLVGLRQASATEGLTSE